MSKITVAALPLDPPTAERSFVWGAATAAYQIEGAVDTDGRGPSIWDTFVRRPGVIKDGFTGDVACDHYHRWKEDVSLMRAIGLQAYRFSLSWSRVLPDGKGRVNRRGLDFYDRLVDGLLGAGIQPWATLLHFEYPQGLHEAGGWLRRNAADEFADYAAIVAAKLGDRVKHWLTINEPAVLVHNGYGAGFQAPGVKYSLKKRLAVAHHLLLGHGRAVKALRATLPVDAQVGWAPNAVSRRPATLRAADVRAAERDYFDGARIDAEAVSWYCDPVYLGRYPEDGIIVHGHKLPRGWEADLTEISQPLNFIGVNIYSATTIRAGRRGAPVIAPRPPGAPMSTMDWLKVEPESLYWGPKCLASRYPGLPIFITENGCGLGDFVDREGRVHDGTRIAFLEAYLGQLLKARREGVPVAGYFHWTLLDNFEWSEGFTQRLGLIHTDFITQKRTLKDSAYWYAEVIRTSGSKL